MDGRQHGLAKEDNHLSAHDGVQQRAQQTMAKMKKIIASPMGKRKQNGAAVYGVALGELMIQAGHGAHVPVIMDKLIDFISTHGLDEQGLFRVSGSAKVVEKVKTLLDKGGEVDLEQFLSDISAVAGALKLFLRELPDPLIPSYQHAMFIRASKKCDGSDDKLVEELKSLVAILPLSNRNILKYLCSFLATVTQHENTNKMNAKGLGIVFGPNVFRCTMEGMEGLQEQTCTNVIVEKFVSRYEDIFAEPPSASAYHRSMSSPTPPLSPVNTVLRSMPQGNYSASASPPHKPKPYRQYMADKEEAGSSPKHARHASDSAVGRADDGESADSSAGVTSPQRSMTMGTGDDSRERRLNRWNSASSSPHHGPRISAARSPGPIRRMYNEPEKASVSNGDVFLSVPNGFGLSGVEGDGRAESPWSPAGSAMSTPVPRQALSPNSNALVDDAIEKTISEQLLGMTYGADGADDDGAESAIGSLGSGSIHHFSGEDMADIMAPGQRNEGKSSAGKSNLILQRDQVGDSHDTNSEDDDVVMVRHAPLGRVTRAETTAAVVTTPSGDMSRHAEAAQDDPKHQRSHRSGSVQTTLNVGRGAQVMRGVLVSQGSDGGQDPHEDGSTAATSERPNERNSSPRKKERPAVPARPKLSTGRSTDDERHDGAVVSMMKGPGRKFDEVTANVEVLRPLTRDRPAGPPRRSGSLTRKGRERLASIPTMSDKAEESVSSHRRSGTLPAGSKLKRMLPELPVVARSSPPLSAAPAGIDVQDVQAPGTDGQASARDPRSGLPATSRFDVDETIEPYAVVRTTPDLASRSSGEDRSVSTSPPSLDDFVYQCKVPSTEEYDAMDVPEIGMHVRELKEVARNHDKAFFNLYGRKAHHSDRKAILNVIVSLASAKKRLEALKKEQTVQVSTTASVNMETSETPPPSHGLHAAETSRQVPPYRGTTPVVSSPSPENADNADNTDNAEASSASAPQARVNDATADAASVFAFSAGSAGAVDLIWRALTANRRAADRPSDVSVMTARQLVDEKHAVQKQLLLYESVFGRPKSSDDRRTMKPVYEHYKILKREIDRRDINIEAIDGGVSPPPTIQTLSMTSTLVDDSSGGGRGAESHTSAMQHSTSRVQRDRIVSDRTGERSPSPLASVERDHLSRSLPVAGVPNVRHVHDRLASTSGVGVPDRKDSTTSNAPISPGWVGDMRTLTRVQLLEQFKYITDDKQRVKQKLKQYEDEFFQRTGRRVEKEDRGAMVQDYEEYKQAKAKLRLIETLLAKIDARNSETC